VHHCAHTLLFLLPIAGTESLPFCVCGAALSTASSLHRGMRKSLSVAMIVRELFMLGHAPHIRVDNTFCSVMQDQPIEGWKDQCVRAAVDSLHLNPKPLISQV
jgi:hypothetical protein